MAAARPCLIHEGDYVLVIARDDAALVDHLKKSDPTEVAYLELKSDDEAKISAMFNEDTDSKFIGLEGAWNRYSEPLGLHPI